MTRIVCTEERTVDDVFFTIHKIQTMEYNGEWYDNGWVIIAPDRKFGESRDKKTTFSAYPTNTDLMNFYNSP